MVALAVHSALEPVEVEEPEEDWDAGALPPRRRARALAVQALFELDATQHDEDSVLDALLETAALDARRSAFTRDLVAGVRACCDGLDESIRRFAPAWPVEQLSMVDRCLLRLAIYELTVLAETAPKVVINEAVELAKLFGGDSSPRFVNGVLGSLHDAMHGHDARQGNGTTHESPQG